MLFFLHALVLFLTHSIVSLLNPLVHRLSTALKILSIPKVDTFGIEKNFEPVLHIWSNRLFLEKHFHVSRNVIL